MNTVQSTGTTTTYSLSKFTILLVEDYEFMQNLITGMLRAFGVGQIIVAEGGIEAQGMLNVMANSKSSDVKLVDIVITDWMMPEGSGDKLTKWIRNHKKDPVKFMPVLTISSYASKEMIVASRDSGANEALVKPLSGEKLAKRILSMIDHPRPFVKSPDFFGPDRRRRQLVWSHDERRQMDPEMVKVNNEQP